MQTTREWWRNLGLVAAGVCAALGVVAWLAWERSPERRAASVDEEISAIEATMQADRAALIRERAECSGGGLEFGAAYAQACIHALQVQSELMVASTDRASRALDTLRAERARLLPKR